MHEGLRQNPGNYIAGSFRAIDGDALRSFNPAAPEQVVWAGSPRLEDVDAAVEAARSALDGWSQCSQEDRISVLRRWQQATTRHADRLAGLITDEMGKTLAESLQESKALGEKVDITLDCHSLGRVAGYEVAVSDSRRGYCRFRPHGVMAVIAPFNFPAHLANGHFVPALLMGNSVILKPSDKTPGVGQVLAELMHEAGAPPGVFNVVQGGSDVAARLADHDGVDGIAFTGSWPVGRRILEANLDRPGRIVALEMGGNNAAVVMADANLRQAVIECVRSAFATTGQRCTCTRRIIVQRPVADRFIPAFCKAASTLLVGPGRSNEPVFMGPLITSQAVEQVLHHQRAAVHAGGRLLIEAARLERSGHFVTPGVVEVPGFSLDRDEEVFGPLVQIAVVHDLDEAIMQANASRYGLVASLFTTSDAAYERFLRQVKAGCINLNAGTAGASSKLPFGGVGRSGNQRPAGAFSVDYCAYPVASLVESSADASAPAGMHWDDRWI